jgi:hypothetical protein
MVGIKQNDYDKHCIDCISDSINLTIPWYLLASYAYYEEDDPILSDAVFDRLGQKMLKNWETIEHIHKTFITEDMLEAGTFIGTYPSRIRGALDALRGK